MIVTALLVTHNGAHWLPRVLEALASQTHPINRLVAVDTGSTDGSVELVRSRSGLAPVELPGTTSFGEAVNRGLASLPTSEDEEWIWILHDDSAPSEECLEELVKVAERCEDKTAVLGPKLREWPTLRRLLEVGVTVTGTGRRETGLETGEPDQGQHDVVDRVLAVNTAGMLVRRSVLKEFGFAEELPLFANDLDFGWRLAAQGLETHLVPTAVMFHAEAAYRGRRDAELAREYRRDSRAASMFVVLANGSRGWHGIRLVRMFLSGLLRAFGFAVVRAFPEAKAELAALGVIYGSPFAHHGARNARQSAATVPSKELRGLLAPFWMPWRHGLDFTIDFFQALVGIGTDAMRTRIASEAAKGSIVRRVLTSPTSAVLAALLVAALIAEGSLFGSNSIRGGALLPAPAGPGHWWSLWWSNWHWIGYGSAAPGPPYALPMAVASTVALASPSLVLWMIFVLGVPAAGVGAWRWALRVGVGRWARAWVCGAYALIPVGLSALADGHLGTMVVAILLPWIAVLVLRLNDDSAYRRSRSVWRLVLIGALAACFAPIVAFFLVLLALGAGPFGLRRVSIRQRIVIGIAPWILLLPWLLSALRAPGALLIEAAGRTVASPGLDGWALVTGSLPGGYQVPGWLIIGFPVAAIAALARSKTRPAVLRCWVVATIAALIALIMARLSFDLPGRDDVEPYLGVCLLIELAAFITAAAIATRDLRDVVAETSFGQRQILVGVATLLGLLAPLAIYVGWFVHAGDGALGGGSTQSADVPAPRYIADLAATSPTQATLVIASGDPLSGAHAVSYEVRRTPLVLGDEALLDLTSPHTEVKEAINAILADRNTNAAKQLADAGISYVFAPSPVNSQVAGAFDTAEGFSPSATPDPNTRAWRINVPTSTNGLGLPNAFQSGFMRIVIAVQLLALLIVMVLAAPGRRTNAEREA